MLEQSLRSAIDVRQNRAIVTTRTRVAKGSDVADVISNEGGCVGMQMRHEYAAKVWSDSSNRTVRDNFDDNVAGC